MRRGFDPMRLTVALAAAVWLGGTGIVRATDASPDARLQAVEKQLEETRDRAKALDQKSEELAREVQSLQDDLIKAARAAQDTEEDLSKLEADLAELRTREKAVKAELGGRDAQMIRVLMGLERLALRPPEALIAQPMPPDDIVRSALLLRSAVPELEAQAKVLRTELERLAEIRTRISEKRTSIALSVAKLDKQHGHLAVLYEKKASVAKKTEAERKKAAQRAEALARDAGSLRDLMARLEEERKRREAEAKRLASLVISKPAVSGPVPAPGRKPTGPDAAETRARQQAEAQVAALSPGRPLESLKGAMPLPARGKVVLQYGEMTDAGTTNKGLVIETRPGAQVIAAGDGIVAYAGVFRGYGQLLIMEHTGGYHTLLSGMGRIDAVVGQKLLSGEPVGVMAADGVPSLYVELRQDGRPINPQSWLLARSKG